MLERYAAETGLIVAIVENGVPAGRIWVHVRVEPEIVPDKQIGYAKTPFFIPAVGTVELKVG